MGSDSVWFLSLLVTLYCNLDAERRYLSIWILSTYSELCVSFICFARYVKYVR